MRDSITAADIGPSWPLEWFTQNFEKSCAALQFSDVEPTMRRFLKDPRAIEPHYPWLAFAVYSYRRAGGQGKDQQDLAPADFLKTLAAIAVHCRELQQQLATLDDAIGAAAGSGNWPKFQAYARAQHLMLLAFGTGTTGLWPSEHAPPEARERFSQWESYLLGLSDAADEGVEAIRNDRTVRGGSGPRQPGVGVFVSILAAVWESATGRRASAEKVETKATNDPPFVRFVKAIAQAANLPPPTRSTVAALLRPPFVVTETPL
jgi:hypothetical protein